METLVGARGTNLEIALSMSRQLLVVVVVAFITRQVLVNVCRLLRRRGLIDITCATAANVMGEDVCVAKGAARCINFVVGIFAVSLGRVT